MANPKVRGFFNRPKDVGIDFTGSPSMTQQHCAGDVDLNELVDRNFNLKDPAFATKLQLSGRLHVKTNPIYGDFTSLGDYQTALNTVRTAEDQFNSLPAKVRDRFQNDPTQLYSFVMDEKNFDEAVSLGLIEKPETEKPIFPTVNPQEAGQQAVSATSSETSAQATT